MAHDADLSKAYLADVQNARARDAALTAAGVKNTRANVLAIGAASLVLVTLVIVVWATNMDDFAKSTITLICGRALGWVEQVFSFEFGTTRTSTRKTTRSTTSRSPDAMQLRTLSNCILFAILLLSRRSASDDRRRKKSTPAMRKNGEYLVVRWSDWGKFPHVHHGRMGNDSKIRVVSYKPLSPRKRALPPPLFAGKAVWGDVRKKPSE